MLALAADEQGIGKWQSFTRNLVEDFKRVFGEEPGKVTSIEIVTDTDNTGGDAEAFYGDITVGAALARASGPQVFGAPAAIRMLQRTRSISTASTDPRHQRSANERLRGCPRISNSMPSSVDQLGEHVDRARRRRDGR